MVMMVRTRMMVWSKHSSLRRNMSSGVVTKCVDDDFDEW